MTTFYLKIDTDNESFNDGMGGREEVSRILTDLSVRVVDTDAGTVRDDNGNAVGEWGWTE